MAEDHPIADLASVGDNGPWSEAALLSYKTVATEITSVVDDRAVADGGSGLDNDIRPDGQIASEIDSWSDDGGGMYAGGGLERLSEELQSHIDGLRNVADPDHG